MHCEQLGNVQINELQHVIELDAGFRARESQLGAGGDVVVPADVLASAEEEMVIVIACMNEELQTIEGVLSGVPHDCLPILVSNSDRPGRPSNTTGEDRYAAEVRLLKTFCGQAHRSAIAVHQEDGGVAAAFRAAGMSEIVDVAGTGLVHRGKGEAMIIGMAIAALTGRRCVGFIDADNFVPGSVTEYCKVFAAALHSARSPCAMVRVAWNSKPKVRGDRLVFDKKGRSSRVVNEWLNKLLQVRRLFFCLCCVRSRARLGYLFHFCAALVVYRVNCRAASATRSIDPLRAECGTEGMNTQSQLRTLNPNCRDYLC